MAKLWMSFLLIMCLSYQIQAQMRHFQNYYQAQQQGYDSQSVSSSDTTQTEETYEPAPDSYEAYVAQAQQYYETFINYAEGHHIRSIELAWLDFKESLERTNLTIEDFGLSEAHAKQIMAEYHERIAQDIYDELQANTNPSESEVDQAIKAITDEVALMLLAQGQHLLRDPFVLFHTTESVLRTLMQQRREQYALDQQYVLPDVTMTEQTDGQSSESGNSNQKPSDLLYDQHCKLPPYEDVPSW